MYENARSSGKETNGVVVYMYTTQGVVMYIYQYINKFNIINCNIKLNSKNQTVARARHMRMQLRHGRQAWHHTWQGRGNLFLVSTFR